MQRGKADAALSSYSLGLMSPNDVGCLTPQWWNDMLSLVWDNIDLVASGSWLSRPGGRAVMGGPEGVRGQPSTWLTQLVERLLRHTEDPGWLARWLAGWLTPTLSHTHKHIHTYRQTYRHIDSTDRNAHTPFFCLSLSGSQSLIHSRPCPDLWHQCCQDTGLHVGFNQQHCQSMALVHTRTQRHKDTR